MDLDNLTLRQVLERAQRTLKGKKSQHEQSRDAIQYMGKRKRDARGAPADGEGKRTRGAWAERSRKPRQLRRGDLERGWTRSNEALKSIRLQAYKSIRV